MVVSWPRLFNLRHSFITNGDISLVDVQLPCVSIISHIFLSFLFMFSFIFLGSIGSVEVTLIALST